MGLKVLHVEPGRALVLEGGWLPAAEDDGPGRCRLHRALPRPRAGWPVLRTPLLLELPHFVMERLDALRY